MTHIVFNETDPALLKSAIELDESLQGDIVLIKDDYSLGPIENIYETEGIEARKQWWSSVLSGGDFDKVTNEPIDDVATIQQLIGKLEADDSETVWIWAAQNAHDVCGYYWLLPFLKPFQSRVQILYLNNLPFINEKGNIFYPTKLSEIQPREFIKAKKLARDITLSEFEVDPDEWTKYCNEQKIVRILEGGKKIIQFNEDHFDAELKKYIMPDWQKASKIINHFTSKSKFSVPESYLLWRLKTWTETDLYDVQGKVANMKDFELKYKSKTEVQETIDGQ